MITCHYGIRFRGGYSNGDSRRWNIDSSRTWQNSCPRKQWLLLPFLVRWFALHRTLNSKHEVALIIFLEVEVEWSPMKISQRHISVIGSPTDKRAHENPREPRSCSETGFKAYMKQMTLWAWFQKHPKSSNYFILRHEIHNPNISPCPVELTRSHESG